MINEEVNNPEGTEEQSAQNQSTDQSQYMPKADVSTSSTPPSTSSTIEGSEISVPPTTETPTQSYGFERKNSELLWVAQKVSDVRTELSKFVIGQAEMVDLLMTGIFSNGHVLLEGVPGVAKTLSAKVLAKSLNVDFARIQFTPDMMPSDVIGTSVFNMKDAQFSFRKGPIFSNIV